MSLLPALVMLPLSAALASTLAPLRWRGPLGVALAVLLAGVACGLLRTVVGDGPQAHALGGWAPPLGIALVADGLAAGMVVLTATVALPCALHAALGLRGEAVEDGFWPLFWFMWAALNGIWLSADLFNLYVGLELLGLAAVGLVALKGSAGALAAAMRYLLAALLGSLAYLIGVALLYAAWGSLALADLAGFMAEAGVAQSGSLTTLVALGLMSAGLLLKTALFPLHGWLPPAHGGALPPVSALLSALVIKASLYILMRLWIMAGPALTPLALGWLLGALGAAAVFWGGWMALRQARLKHLVAYSTVAQIGYLFLFFPLFGVANMDAARLAWDGTLLMLAAHALAKAGMFLAAGNLVLAVGSPHIADLTGISRFRPLSLMSFGLAGVSLMGLPPSAGFTAKWLLLQSALASGQWVWIMVLVGGGLLSAAYVFRVFRHAFVEGPARDRFASPPLALELSALALGSASIALGLVAQAPLEWLRIGSPLATGVP
ncbi:proton-conducting transporter membrane subunit [Thauera sp.]|uniref:complex I subunit 5 family protein n=1 Tax=Thauera sp. TaxID=1905334 RepID=UPI002582DE5E|nr:proton-conducting transporter membrane subunit [Thauera sp.]